MLAPLLAQSVKMRGEGQVLDVGSGTGAMAFALAKAHPRCRVVGIDPAEEYVAYANANNAYPERVEFQTGDAQQLQFPGTVFDAAVSLLVFNFIPDTKKALREVIRVTKPGGTIAAAVWDYGTGMRMLRVFWDAVVALDAGAGKLDERQMPLCRSGELAGLWQQHGLENVQEKPLDFVMRFTSFADYWEPFLLGQGPAGAYVAKADARRQFALRGEIKRQLSVSREDAPFSLPARAWGVRGTVPAQ
jgi:SAM-dependent methyltransferase